MHVVEFLLQVLHLPFDGGLLVALLVFLLLGGVGLVGNAGDLHELVKRLLDQLRTFGPAVLDQNGIALGIGDLQGRGHDAGGHADGVHLPDEILRRLRPLKARDVSSHLLDQRLELLLLYRAVQILQLSAAGGHELDGVIGVDAHILQVDPVLRADHTVALLVELCNIAGHANGIKIALGQLRPSLVLFGDDQNDLLSDRDAVCAGAAAELVERIEQRGLGREDHVIGRDNDHVHFSFLLTECSFIIFLFNSLPWTGREIVYRE